MIQQNLLEKVKTLEQDIGEIKKYLGFDVGERDKDAEIWKSVKQDSKEIRKEIFKKRYPGLYAKTKSEK